MPLAGWNGVMTFGASGNFRAWARSGWARPEGNITWMEGHEATIEFTMPKPDADQVLKAKLLSVKSRAPQQMYVYLNGYCAGIFTASSDGLNECVVQADRDFFSDADDSRNML